MSRIYDTHRAEYQDAEDRAEAEDHDRAVQTDGMTLQQLCSWMRGPADSDCAQDVHVGTDHDGRTWTLTAEYQRFGDGAIEARTVFLMDLPRHSAARIARVIRARACI